MTPREQRLKIERRVSGVVIVLMWSIGTLRDSSRSTVTLSKCTRYFDHAHSRTCKFKRRLLIRPSYNLPSRQEEFVHFSIVCSVEK